MNKSKLGGVIAAVATACDGAGEPDCARSVALARFLLDNGCDGLNVLGTTGEATSYALAQRQAVMNAYRAAGLPLDRMMVGSGGGGDCGCGGIDPARRRAWFRRRTRIAAILL